MKPRLCGILFLSSGKALLRLASSAQPLLPNPQRCCTMDRASAVAIEGHEYSELSNPSASHIPAPPQGALGSDQAGSSATSYEGEYL